MLNLLLASAAFLPQGPGTSTAPVVINEFSYDDASTDDREFIELYNRSGVPVDISGWSILGTDPIGATYGAGTGPEQLYVIPGAPGSGTTVMLPGTFYVLGPATVTGVNQVIGTTNLLENDNEAIELRDATGTIVDSIAYELGVGNVGPHPLEGDGFQGDLAVGDATGAPSSSIARMLDGYDNNDNGRDFVCSQTPTPGSSNNVASVLPYLETFDTSVVGGAIPGWHRGWVFPTCVDPTSTSSQNPTVKPASPQGGFAMATWDSSGGGNTVSLTTAPVADVVVECYAWFEPMMTPVNPGSYPQPIMANTYNVGDGEWWALGVRGTASANSNPPNVGGYFTTISLGVGTRHHFVTGIAWAHFRTPTYSNLYLVDFNNGSNFGNPLDFTVLAGPIAILPGVNDGWQRLRLHVQGNDVVANFGGSFGFDDGQRVVATTTTTGPGSVYVAYREAVLYNSNGAAGCRPPLFDLFDAHVPTTAKTIFGSPSPTTVATPTIGSNGLAIAGSTGFAITASGMVPLGHPSYTFCAVVLGFSSFAPGYPIPGAPPAAMGYVLPILSSSIGFADPSGAVSFPFSLPATYAFNGVTLSAQVVDFDPALAAATPIGTSAGMDNVIGN